MILNNPTISSEAVIDPSTAICKQVTICGDVKIGARNILHPTCLIDARNGKIVIGDENIVEEQVKIINSGSSTLYIGNCNCIEVGTNIEDAASIGDLNLFHPKCNIESNATIKDGCTIGSGATVPPNFMMESKSVLYDTLNDIVIDEDAIDKHSVSIKSCLNLLTATLKINERS